MSEPTVLSRRETAPYTWLVRTLEPVLDVLQKKKNKVKSVAYSGNRPASNVVTVLTELSCFRLLWVPAVRRTSGDVTDRYRKMFKACANVGLSLHSSFQQGSLCTPHFKNSAIP